MWFRPWNLQQSWRLCRCYYDLNLLHQSMLFLSQLTFSDCRGSCAQSGDNSNFRGKNDQVSHLHLFEFASAMFTFAIAICVALAFVYGAVQNSGYHCPNNSQSGQAVWFDSCKNLNLLFHIKVFLLFINIKLIWWRHLFHISDRLIIQLCTTGSFDSLSSHTPTSYSRRFRRSSSIDTKLLSAQFVFIRLCAQIILKFWPRKTVQAMLKYSNTDVLILFFLYGKYINTASIKIFYFHFI